MDAVQQGITGCSSQSVGQEAAGRVCRLLRHFLRPLVLVGTGMLHSVEGHCAISMSVNSQAYFRLSFSVVELDWLSEKESLCSSSR